MNNIYNLFHMIRADFQERSRRYSFLLILMLNLFLSYQVFVGKFTLRLGEYKGFNNDAWVGASITITSTLLLILLGYYLIKNSISRDSETGVGQILAATSMSKFTYLFSKLLSNFFALAVMVIIIMLTGLVLLLFEIPIKNINLLQFCAPFIFIALPPMFLIAAIAVFFESISWLRGGLGNIIYFIIFMSILPLSMETNIPAFDIMGFNLFFKSMENALLMQHPGVGTEFILNPELIPNLNIFIWNGINWTIDLFLPKLYLIGIGISLIFAATIFFNRFDPVKTKKVATTRQTQLLGEKKTSSVVHKQTTIKIQKLDKCKFDFSIIPLLKLELKMMLRGQNKIWFAIVIGLMITQLFTPFDIMREYIIPITLVFPIMIWSMIGFRDNRYNTSPITLSVPYPHTRQIITKWMGGIIVGIVVISTGLLRSAVMGEFQYTGTLLMAVIFIPTLSLTLCYLSGSNRLFEVLYIVIWYLGPLNHMPQLDFVGATLLSIEQGIPIIFMVITFVLIPIMWVGLKLQSFRE